MCVLCAVRGVVGSCWVGQTLISDVCVDCEIGKYKNSVGNHACDSCPENTGDRCCTLGLAPTCSAACPAAGACLCNTGYYGPNRNAPCTRCPDSSGQYLIRGADITDCKCNARYFGPAGGPCPACRANSGSQCSDVNNNNVWCHYGWECMCNPGLHWPGRRPVRGVCCRKIQKRDRFWIMHTLSYRFKFTRLKCINN